MQSLEDSLRSEKRSRAQDFTQICLWLDWLFFISIVSESLNTHTFGARKQSRSWVVLSVRNVPATRRFPEDAWRDCACNLTEAGSPVARALIYFGTVWHPTMKFTLLLYLVGACVHSFLALQCHRGSSIDDELSPRWANDTSTRLDTLPNLLAWYATFLTTACIRINVVTVGFLVLVGGSAPMLSCDRVHTAESACLLKIKFQLALMFYCCPLLLRFIQLKWSGTTALSQRRRCASSWMTADRMPWWPQPFCKFSEPQVDRNFLHSSLCLVDLSGLWRHFTRWIASGTHGCEFCRGRRNCRITCCTSKAMQ